MILRKPDRYFIDADGECNNTLVEFDFTENYIDVYVTSRDKLKFLTLRWDFVNGGKRSDSFRICGDAWERSYGDMAWRGIEPDRIMPWYFAVSNGSDSDMNYDGRFTECFGVGVRPGAMCSWKYDTSGITLNMDIRNGALPVELGGKRLYAARIFFREYRAMSAFSALGEFCKVMCPERLESKNVIYGSNNWYYAYGNSSREEILSDTRLIAELCKENENPPYMVIDDGWQVNRCDAPWESNEKFGDMKSLADEMSSAGVIPGIWVRYLVDGKHSLNFPDECRRNKDYLDPTHPLVLEYVADVTKKLNDWGYKLIKHDFSTFDISGRWGKNIGKNFCGGNEGFYDKSKTTAQVIVDFYRVILDTSPEAVILGCNTVGHLCAGLVHANRTGDDTSGRDWSVTKYNGVNTLAFRLCQNKIFYDADPDCVGIMGKFPWELNRQWLDLVAKSGTTLFVSCKPSEAENSQIAQDLKIAYIPASAQNDTVVPLDWMETNCPTEYLVNGEKKHFDWYE